MQNKPRIFINQHIETGDNIVAEKHIIHYLTRVMRTNDCLIFNDGAEYYASLSNDGNHIIVGDKTNHVDPSNDLVFYFAPIKKTDEMLNMVTQMGVKVLQPVITERTVARHINWERMIKIIIEASEQSGRNSIPQLLSPILFKDLDFNGLIVADERAGHGKEIVDKIESYGKLFVGPEGGFSPQEFDAMDKAGVYGLSLGKTILRAEVAAVVAIAKVLNK
jgi:RNA methyltransferase, RsmE family